MTTPPSERPGLVVVVPVYGDLPSLLDCVASLVQHVDVDRHSVLLVNDCGPDADAIERALLSAIDGRRGFRYERNDHNLGFVGTCNRAATELDTSDADVLLLNSDTVVTAGALDEMHEVLLAEDHHGVVCARSNNATIASMPFRQVRPAERTTERTVEVFERISPLLPRWYVTPVAMGFCFLTRRSLIREFGLFDEAFAPGYGEENDYCLRINGHGWSSVMANRALVLHAGSKSFVGARRNTLRDAHQKKLEARYPFYGQATGAFLRHDVHPADRFADALVPTAGPASITVDLRGAATAGLDGSTLDSVVAALSSAATDRVSLEFLVDTAAVPAVSAGAPMATVRDDAPDDQIASLGVLVPGLVDSHRLLQANRRYAAWASLDLGLVAQSVAWSDGLAAVGRRHVASVVAEHAAVQLTLDGREGSTALSDLLAASAGPVPRGQLAEEVEQLVRRTRWVGLADVVAQLTSGPDASAANRYRDELNALKSSRSYVLATRVARLARRVPGVTR
ncbi:glycosyltransferase family 2 protein [Frigoribacterium sp. PvP032]|uniref:glycosyltransferase family 2 protein n=1 Tax=Frigoribacterium sp. PvP032 TaxID=2806589 RepID=UPI001AE2F220|nr:glycosyltransferase family 2 protein [Frigoribacterium sp. PvP032]MBP1190249.1 GT2 family glycosyltransferase [Frigoribacterium sp. PvP032]